jgi:hypothetical protein
MMNCFQDFLSICFQFASNLRPSSMAALLLFDLGSKSSSAHPGWNGARSEAVQAGGGSAAHPMDVFGATVGRCRLSLSTPVLKARLVSALETNIRENAFNFGFQIQRGPLRHGGARRVVAVRVFR